MKLKIGSKLTAISSALLVGCASIVSGPSWLEMETNPANVDVTLVGVENGSEKKLVTPFKVELDRSTDYRLTVETENYRSEEIYIDRKINGWFWGNILLGGPLGMVIDYATDSMWKHNQSLIALDLTSLSTAPDEIELKVPVKLEYPDSSYETVFLPIKFYKKQPGHANNVTCPEITIEAIESRNPNCKL
ncbi:hypothetical protein [Planktothricoides raciborskii]|uniref:PEGA domain-containing protein n=2 Tax=Planktothricoides raciborskii TaxID=132608 RepID=A0AAU8JJW0_9CYAN|nr:hypothetical protein [Planktothricoides raciborskii]MBD2547858.1 hypothetical protein [Planktothricoides raciborskii FACHB-1370]MBD2586300.1 hypothetical protein [Planktothricoides raciborskii FACHB-1261]